MTIHFQRNGAVTTVVIDRPAARNAIDRATAQALADAFREFDADPAQHVAVLCGANGHFCAGADLKAFVANPGDWSLQEEGDAPLGPTRMLLSKPVIAAVSGYAVAGGLELALWCDLRVVEASATFGVFCRRWGVPLIDGGTLYLAGRFRDWGLDVHYPGLPAHPQHEFLTRVMNPGYGYGGIVALDTGDVAKANRLMARMQEEKVGYLAVSLGYFKTLFSPPGHSTSSEIPPEERRRMGMGEGLIRFSVGLDNDIESTWKTIESLFREVGIAEPPRAA